METYRDAVFDEVVILKMTRRRATIGEHPVGRLFDDSQRCLFALIVGLAMARREIVAGSTDR